MRLDSVQIGVTDLDAASQAYAVLLGAEPVQLAVGSRRFQLRRGAVELEVGQPGVQSVGFVREASDSAQRRMEHNVLDGLVVRFGSHAEFQPPRPAAADSA